MAAMTGCDTAKLRWEDGVPVSEAFDDPYYARSDGLAESRHVFLAGNRLEARFAGAVGFHLAELGFGTGLNLCAALIAWRALAAPGAVLRYTAFERYPMAEADRARALARWPEATGVALGADVDLEVIGGDARQAVPAWEGAADAWFLDGFAPARNPEMWEPALLAAVFQRTVPGGTCATYSAAGAVRRGLQAAGFDVARVPGFGTKREMLVGVRPAASVSG